MKLINWQGVQAVVQCVNLAAVILLAAYTWIVGRNKASAAAMTAVTGHLAVHDARLDVIETEGKHALTHRDLSPLYEAVNGIGREMAELRGSVMGMQRLVEGMNRHLMEGNK